MFSEKDIDFKVEGVIDIAEFINRPADDTTFNNYLVLPDKTIVDPAKVIGRYCSDLFDNLPGELNVAIGDLLITVAQINDTAKVLHGGRLCFFGLTVSKCELAGLHVPGAAFGHRFAVADCTVADIVIVRAADFRAGRAAVEAVSGILRTECERISVRKSVFEELRFDAVKISNQLSLDRCQSNAISFVGNCELNNLLIKGISESALAFDFKKVSLSGAAPLLIAPANMYPALERLQKN